MMRREVGMLALLLIVLCVVSWLGFSQMIPGPVADSGGGMVVIHSFSSAPDLTVSVIVHEMSMPNATKHRASFATELAFARYAMRVQEYLGLFGPGYNQRSLHY